MFLRIHVITSLSCLWRRRIKNCCRGFSKFHVNYYKYNLPALIEHNQNSSFLLDITKLQRKENKLKKSFLRKKKLKEKKSIYIF